MRSESGGRSDPLDNAEPPGKSSPTPLPHLTLLARQKCALGHPMLTTAFRTPFGAPATTSIPVECDVVPPEPCPATGTSSHSTLAVAQLVKVTSFVAVTAAVRPGAACSCQ
jgi:hypothetical protein